MTNETTEEVVSPINDGDNAWMMISSILVLLMTPALAFFYAGLVHRKNVLNQLFLSFICMGIVGVQWVLFGFSFAFGEPISSAFGSFSDAALRFTGERTHPFYSPTYPFLTYAAYQGTFAVICTAIVSGSIVGRIRLIPYMIFVFLWTTACYDPMANWVWSERGWLRVLGSLDYAGGTAVHILSGTAGLVASIIIGKRIDYHADNHTAHNLPFTVLGCSLLWVGWIGFNAGSAGGSNASAALAIVNTNTAAAAGLVTWVILDVINGRVSISGACSGPLMGLVSVTPASGFIQPGWSILFGIIPTIIIYFLIRLKKYLRFDDALDVGIMHAGGGICGAFMTGLFSEKSYNPVIGFDGAFYGRPIQLWYQIVGILTAIAFSSVCTAGILIPLHFLIGIRTSAEDEAKGLDWALHGENWDLAAAEEKPVEIPTDTSLAPLPNLKEMSAKKAQSVARLHKMLRGELPSSNGEPTIIEMPSSNDVTDGNEITVRF